MHKFILLMHFLGKCKRLSMYVFFSNSAFARIVVTYAHCPVLWTVVPWKRKQSRNMSKRVTIQDIADALGYSRNTVSKAINNSNGLAIETRDKILQKAVELGYKQFSYVNDLAKNGTPSVYSAFAGPRSKGEIAVLTPIYLSSSHFATKVLQQLKNELDTYGFTIVSHMVSEDDLKHLSLPQTLNIERAAAIICVEMFDWDYSNMVCSTTLPVLFFDAPAPLGGKKLKADLMMMENTMEIMRFINTSLSRGLLRIGFIGNFTHCRSFYERYATYRMTMIGAGAAVNEKFIINTADQDLAAMESAVLALDEMPDIFICSNDFVAIDFIHILRKNNIDFMRKVKILGFDDSHESKVFYPSISSIHIHAHSMAQSALNMLMTRLQNPSMEFRTMYVATDLVLRESTEF